MAAPANIDGADEQKSFENDKTSIQGCVRRVHLRVVRCVSLFVSRAFMRSACGWCMWVVLVSGACGLASYLLGARAAFLGSTKHLLLLLVVLELIIDLRRVHHLRRTMARQAVTSHCRDDSKDSSAECRAPSAERRVAAHRHTDIIDSDDAP